MMWFLERRLFFLAGFLLVVGSIAISGLLAVSSVQADANTTYCSPDAAIGTSYFNDDHHSKEDALKAMTKDDKGVCAANLVKDFNTKYKANNRQMTVDDMAQAISTCRTGDADGLGDELAYTRCANAYYTCMERVLQPSDCLTDKDRLSNIADLCHNGTGVQANGEAVNCDYITDANVNYAEKQRDAAKSSYDATCETLSKKNTDPSEQNKSYNNCLAAMNGGLDNCKMKDAKFDYIEYGHSKTPSNFVADTTQLTSYNNCLQQAKNTAARDNPELCNAVNGGKGFYVAERVADPSGVGNSNVEKGCYSNYSDLKNATACETSGTGVWAQEPGKTGDDGWGCHPPSEVCSGNGKAKEGWKINDLRNCTEENIKSTDKDDPDAECPKDLNGNCATVAGTSQNCGDARVNILGCGSGTKGADAFTAILKIIIIVLTVLVGIAAVGGLAYAALTYARAEDNSGTVSEAKTLIRNIVIGIVLYGFLIAIVTWLVPGLSLT